MEKINFKAEISELMNIIINNFYSNKDIFLRELISNSSDAINKLKFNNYKSTNFFIKISTDKINNILIIHDNGIGMSKDELISNLGTIAKSGTKHFFESLKNNDNTNLIGQFGMGFYSSFLVANKVRVISKKNDETYEWYSESNNNFYISKYNDPFERGTMIKLYLKNSMYNYLDVNNIKNIILKHSQFINYPIELLIEKQENDVKLNIWEHINKDKPLWIKNKNEVKLEQYKDLFQNITKSNNNFIYHKHFFIEGNINLKGVLFIPEKKPHDMFKDYQTKKSNIKLYVKKVLITDDLKEIIPEWLSFIYGIIDCDDLPLNVSREILQNSNLIKIIKNLILKKCIETIEELAKNEIKYLEFYKIFGLNLKVGIHQNQELSEKLVELLRYKSSLDINKYISFNQYLSGCDDNDIYYLIGKNINELIQSPLIEKYLLEKKNILFMTESMDEYIMQIIKKYKNSNLVSLSRGKLFENNLELYHKYELLFDHIKDILVNDIQSIKISKRLTSSPSCIISSEMGWSANMERISNATIFNDNSLNNHIKSKKILEMNMEHKINKELYKRFILNKNDQSVIDIIYLIYDLSLIKSGFTIENLNNFSERYVKMIELALKLDDNCDEVEYL